MQLRPTVNHCCHGHTSNSRLTEGTSAVYESTEQGYRHMDIALGAESKWASEGQPKFYHDFQDTRMTFLQVSIQNKVFLNVKN